MATVPPGRRQGRRRTAGLQSGDRRGDLVGTLDLPKRKAEGLAGRVEGNPVFSYHELFNPDKVEVETLKARYRAGMVGDVEVKQTLARVLNAFLQPFRERRQYYEKRPDEVRGILREGTRRANEIASRKMDAIMRRMGLFRP